MSARSLNKVMLIGNMTRDPELRYTPTGVAVCSFGLATNRSWTTDSGEKKEEVEFHKIVSWNKLAELCSQLLAKGRKVFVEGRLQTRSWVGQDGGQRQSTEIVIEDMIILDSKRLTDQSQPAVITAAEPAVAVEEPVTTVTPTTTDDAAATDDKKKTKKQKTETEETTKEPEKIEEKKSDDINPDDIPF